MDFVSNVSLLIFNTNVKNPFIEEQFVYPLSEYMRVEEANFIQHCLIGGPGRFCFRFLFLSNNY